MQEFLLALVEDRKIKAWSRALARWSRPGKRTTDGINAKAFLNISSAQCSRLPSVSRHTLQVKRSIGALPSTPISRSRVFVFPAIVDTIAE